MTAAVRRLRRCERGVTLTEMLVTIAVLSIVGMGFVAMFTSVVNHSASISDGITLQTETRAALDRFASDLRQAYNGDTSDPASYPIDSVTSGTTIVFTTPDRQQPFHLRRVWYRFSGGQFQRAEAISTDTDGWPWAGLPAVGSPPAYRTLVGNVTTAAPFTFYTSTGTTTTTASAVRQVKVAFAVRTNTGRSTTFSENVTLRSDLDT